MDATNHAHFAGSTSLSFRLQYRIVSFGATCTPTKSTQSLRHVGNHDGCSSTERLADHSRLQRAICAPVLGKFESICDKRCQRRARDCVDSSMRGGLLLDEHRLLKRILSKRISPCRKTCHDARNSVVRCLCKRDVGASCLSFGFGSVVLVLVPWFWFWFRGFGFGSVVLVLDNWSFIV